jgi:hypothetical protein
MCYLLPELPLDRLLLLRRVCGVLDGKELGKLSLENSDGRLVVCKGLLGRVGELGEVEIWAG